MKENGFVISQEDESQAQVVLYGLPMGGFVVLLIMLNQELIITETQEDSPRGGTWPWLSLLIVPDRSHVPISSPPLPPTATSRHLENMLLVPVFGQQAPPSPGPDSAYLPLPSPGARSLSCASGQSLGALGKSERNGGAHGSGASRPTSSSQTVLPPA